MSAAPRLQIEDLPSKYRPVQGCPAAQIHTQSAVMYRAPSHCLYQIFLLHSWLYHQTGPPGLFSKKTVWLFCPPRCYDLLTAIYFLYSRKLMYIFFSWTKKKENKKEAEYFPMIWSFFLYVRVMWRSDISNSRIVVPCLALKINK